MVKNEEFYSRAQELLNDYKYKGKGMSAAILKKIVAAVFENGNEFPDDLYFEEQYCDTLYIKLVLIDLRCSCDKIVEEGKYCFTIRGLH